MSSNVGEPPREEDRTCGRTRVRDLLFVIFCAAPTISVVTERKSPFAGFFFAHPQMKTQNKMGRTQKAIRPARRGFRRPVCCGREEIEVRISGSKKIGPGTLNR